LAQYAVSSELIDRGDLLEVSIATDLEGLQPMIAPVRVADDGNADVPLVGKVQLAGLELEEAEQAVAAAAVARGLYRSPHVTVSMKHRRTNHVTVVGAVKAPGVYQLPRASSTLLAAMVAAGGLSEDAGVDVEIQHSATAGNPSTPATPPQPRMAESGQTRLTSFETPSARPLQSVHVNLVSATQEANVGYCVNDGDVIMIAKRPPRAVYVLGLVQKPGQYEIPLDEEMCVVNAISMAGGLSTRLADNVLIIRRGATGLEPIRIETSLLKAKQDATANVRLVPGDVLSVEETPATFVWDFLRSIVRFGLSGSIPLF
jgi:polysaccharide export outer membrane protein